MVSANAPRELAPTNCPYFAPGCTFSDYDLPAMRAGYIAPTNSSLSGSQYTTPLIIMIDTRVTSDPPPIISK